MCSPSFTAITFGRDSVQQAGYLATVQEALSGNRWGSRPQPTAI